MSSTLIRGIAAAAIATTALSAQTYNVQIIAQNLDTPYGISVHSSGDLYFTQLPVPGQFSQRNKVSMFDASTKTVQDLVLGEPAPSHIVVANDRSFYWTCATVGVIMRRQGSAQSPLARGLDNPSGIARDSNGKIFFTQVPNPGTPDPKNNVAELVNGSANVLKAGEPYPFDIVVNKGGDLYWTCKTAGVILKRSAAGTVTKVIDFLEAPSGLAMDDAGNLYFSEVPTPGVPGPQGGRNKIWKFDPATSNLTLVHFGHPEPTDVAVTGDGKSIYWTCATAGVIARADLVDASPRLMGDAMPKMGTTLNLTAEAPTALANKMYIAASSFGHAQFMIDTRYMALEPDFLFSATAMGMGAPCFSGFMGMLDGSAQAKLSIRIPMIPSLSGMNLFTAYGVLDSGAPSGVEAISSTLRVQIQ